MEKRYTCERFPFLRIGNGVKFENGIFVTSDEELQARIERNDSFGLLIKFQEPPKVLAQKAQEANAEKMQGGYRTEKQHDATRQLAGKMGLDEKETEDMVREREKIAKQVHEAMVARKRGRPAKEHVNENTESVQ